MSLTKANSTTEAIKNFLGSASPSIQNGGVYRIVYNDETTNQPMIKSFKISKGGANIYNVKEYNSEEVFTKKVQAGGNLWPVLLPNNNQAIVAYPPVHTVFPLAPWISGYGVNPYYITSAESKSDDMIRRLSSKKVFVKPSIGGVSTEELKNSILRSLRRKFADSNITDIQVSDITFSDESGKKLVKSIDIKYQKKYTRGGFYYRSRRDVQNESKEIIFEEVLRSVAELEVV